MTVRDVGQPSLTTPGTMTVIVGTMTGIAKHIIIIFSIVVIVIVIAHSVNRIVVHIFALTGRFRGPAAGRTHQAANLKKGRNISACSSVRIRIHRIHMFLALPDPDPPIIMQK
jgi:hypothetical protein